MLDVKMQYGVRAKTWKAHKFPVGRWKNKLWYSYNRIIR